MRSYKRKIKKMFSNHSFIIFSIFIIVIILGMTTGYAYLRTELTVGGVSNIVHVCDVDINYEILKIKNQGQSGKADYELRITVKNNGLINYSSWNLKLNDSTVILRAGTDVTLAVRDNATYLEPVTSKMNLPAGGSVVINVTLRITGDANILLDAMTMPYCPKNETYSINEYNADTVEEKTFNSVNLNSNILLVNRSEENGGTNTYEVSFTNNNQYDIGSLLVEVDYLDKANFVSSSFTNTVNDSNNHLLKIEAEEIISKNGGIGNNKLLLVFSGVDEEFMPIIKTTGYIKE